MEAATYFLLNLGNDLFKRFNLHMEEFWFRLQITS